MKKCDVTGYTMIDQSVRSCPHPQVIAKYGRNGRCNVCWLACRKCKYGKKGEYDGGIACRFPEMDSTKGN